MLIGLTSKLMESFYLFLDENCGSDERNFTMTTTAPITTE